MFTKRLISVNVVAAMELRKALEDTDSNELWIFYPLGLYHQEGILDNQVAGLAQAAEDRL